MSRVFKHSVMHTDFKQSAMHRDFKQSVMHRDFKHSKKTWCLTSTKNIRLIRDGENGGKGAWRLGGGGSEVYIYRYTVTTGMTSALRWAAMRVILVVHNCEGQRHKTASTDHNF